MVERIPAYLEIGAKRTFAGAIDWPGWCRSARAEDDALATLLAYGPRYQAAVARAGLSFEPPDDTAAFDVLERVAGGSGTDFGAPSAAPSADERPLDERELARQQALLQAAWATFDETTRDARGIGLRKGPRGGGRDLAKIVAHVIEAEEAYLWLLGSRSPKAPGDPAERWAALREVILAALAARARGEPPERPSESRRSWSPRYFVRRSAWHVLDHAWEIEDRARPAGEDP